MGKSSKKREKERLAVALERIYRKFAFSSQSEMAQAIGFSQPTLSRAMNCLNPVSMKNEKRLQVAQFLGRMCQDTEALQVLVAEMGWEMKEAEWQAALASLGGDEWDLHGVPYLWTEQIVGRTAEIEILQAWMLNERKTVEPILVMQGVGGVGKTVLAIHAARQQVVKEWYQGYIFWVDVERYGETDSIRRLALKVEGKRALQAEDPWRFVTEALRGKRALVLLNGVEEGIDLDQWADLLPPQGRLLVTTRGVGVTGTRVGTRTLKLAGLTSDAAQELLT